MDFFNMLFYLSRFCVGCQSILVKETGFCDFCERKLLQSYHPEKTWTFARVGPGKIQHIPVYSLFSWKRDDNRCLSLLLNSMKGGYQPRLLNWYTDRLLEEFRLDILQDSILVPAPSQLGVRDHALVMAEAIQKKTGLEMVSPLRRASEAKEQKALGHRERETVMHLNPEKITFKSPVIFVDDIITTGSTARAAFRALQHPQNFSVICLARRGYLAGHDTL